MATHTSRKSKETRGNTHPQPNPIPSLNCCMLMISLVSPACIHPHTHCATHLVCFAMRACGTTACSIALGHLVDEGHMQPKCTVYQLLQYGCSHSFQCIGHQQCGAYQCFITAGDNARYCVTYPVINSTTYTVLPTMHVLVYTLTFTGGTTVCCIVLDHIPDGGKLHGV